LNAEAIWLALALVLVIEGFFPFVSPARWRQTILQILQLSDGQLRFFALCTLSCGALLIWWLL